MPFHWKCRTLFSLKQRNLKQTYQIFLFLRSHVYLWIITIEINAVRLAKSSLDSDRCQSKPERPFPVTLLDTGMNILRSSLWNKNVATKASCFQLRSCREGDTPEEHRFDTVGLYPALGSAVASHRKPESLRTNEVHTVLGALTDSLSQSGGVIQIIRFYSVFCIALCCLYF